MKQDNYQGALQHPLQTGFDRYTTSATVIEGIDLTGKVAIVTGGNAGIGLETAKTLAAAGATVIVPARDVDKATKNLQAIHSIEIDELDFMNPASIDAFAERFLATGRSLDILINNAGIMWVPLRRDARGIESQFATNYIGQFHLVSRLWPALRKGNGARVVNVSSLGHHWSEVDFNDPNFEHKDYETLAAYGQSKTASNLFALELDSRAKKYNVRAYSVHPGSIAGTELAREAPLELFQQMGFLDEAGNMRPEITASLKTIQQGAATTIWAATSPLLKDISGVYCEDGDIAELVTEVSQIHQRGVMPYSLDADNCKRLWDLTETMTGIRFDVD